MKPDQTQEETLFNAARELADPKQRAAFLDAACQEDAELRRGVEALLAAQNRAGVFFDRGPQDHGLGLPTTDAASSAPADLPASEKAGDRIGRYKLLQKIGEGGCGIVYVAEQEEPVRRRVALKVIKLGMDTRQVVARFEAERQALALMDHPNIAKVLDAGATESGRPYFVMEMVHGIKITDYCDQYRLSTGARLALFIKVCQAIQHAHQKGIIHRDLKPSNILVALHDSVPVPKVIDFGIAKATDQRLTDKTLVTQFGQFIGTPAYMSPEQADVSGLDIDTRSDIYSLGVLLYELLTGKTPFDGTELMASGIDAMRRTIREKEPQRPSTKLAALQGEELTTTARLRSSDPTKLVHLLRGDLDWIVMKCLEKDRSRRYETANGLAADLKRHLRNEPVVAGPPSTAYRFQKFVRRNKVAFAAAACIAGVLVLATVVSTWQAALANEERQRARRNLYEAEMLLAHQGVDEGNPGLALKLLNEHRPGAGHPELRGWEWRYLWGLCHSEELGIFATNAHWILGLAMSRDGTLLAAAEKRDAVKIWQYPSGQLLDVPESEDAYGSVTMSPDGKLLAFATRKRGVRLWDIPARREITNFPGVFGNKWDSDLRFSPDGRILAASRSTTSADWDDPEILLWDVQTQTLKMLKGQSGFIGAFAFSADSTTLATGSLDGTIVLWSLAMGQEVARFTHLKPHEVKLDAHKVYSVALSPDGTILASGTWSGTIGIWDVRSKRPIALLTNHSHVVTSLSFSPDQALLASGSGDYLLKLWDTTRWQEVSTLKGSPDEIWDLIFSPDGKTLISGGKDGVIRTWDATPKSRKSDSLMRPPDVKWWGLRGGILVCTHTNGTISYRNAAKLRPITQYPWPEEDRTNSVAHDFTPSGKLAWANKQNEIVVWDLTAEQQIARVKWVPGDGKAFKISPDERLLAGIGGERLTIWDLERNGQKIMALTKSPDPVFYTDDAMNFSSDSRLFAAGTWGGKVEVWDLTRKKHVATWRAHQEVVSGVGFLPDGKRLVTVSEDAQAKLWEIETKRELKPFSRTRYSFNAVTVAPDGQRIAAATDFIKIWNEATGREVATLKTGAAELVDAVQFLPPDGNTLVSLTSRELRIWRAPSWAEITAAEAHEKPETKSR